ncbi:MAG TPA: efflux RND transporter periplasmic adaptor subunit [Kiritimatiellia bacterium]
MKKPVVALVVLVVGLAAWVLSHREENSGSVSGTVEADEVRLASRYGGRVESVLAAEGDVLEGGQVIVELAAPELAARRDQAAAQLAELEAGPREQDIVAASNEWAAVVNELALARVSAGRATNLFAVGAIPATERDSAVQLEATLASREAAARSRYEELEAGTRPERVDQARAQLAEIDAQLAEMRVAAPGPTTLESLLVKVGDVVGPNAGVAVLLITTSRWVRVYIPEPWLGHVKAGDRAEVRVDPYPDEVFAGVVEQVSRKAEFTPRNVQTVGERVKQVYGVKVRLEDPKDALQPGMAADVIFPGNG